MSEPKSDETSFVFEADITIKDDDPRCEMLFALFDRTAASLRVLGFDMQKQDVGDNDAPDVLH